MSNLPVATQTVDFELPASPQGLAEAVQQMADKHADDYEFWSSVRSVNGNTYFRLGLKERNKTPAGSPGFMGNKPSGDILFTPHDGKDDEWFALGTRHGRVCVRSRVCSAGLDEPLYDLSVAESLLTRTVGIFAVEFTTIVNKITPELAASV